MMSSRMILVITAIATCHSLLALPGLAADDKKETIESIQTRKLVQAYRARGVQHYECNGREWEHKGPSAVLYDDKGKPVAVHYSCASCDGPGHVATWNFFDKTQVEATGKLQAKPSDSKTGGVAQLALKVETNGQGKLAGANRLLRVKTDGGQPLEPCGQNDKGKWTSSPYSTIYEFRDVSKPADAAAPAANRPAAPAGAGTRQAQ